MRQGLLPSLFSVTCSNFDMNFKHAVSLAYYHQCNHHNLCYHHFGC